MAWTPTKTVLNPRAIAENLLAYCTTALDPATSQELQLSAINWVTSGTPMRLIKRVSDIKADPTLTPYPAVEFSDDNDEQEFGDDLIPCVYTVTFDFGVQATTAAQAVADARVYDQAFRSMIVNCPASTLSSGTGAITATAQVINVQTGFLPIQAGNQGKATNDFLQQFQMRVTVSLIGNAHT